MQNSWHGSLYISYIGGSAGAGGQTFRCRLFGVSIIRGSTVFDMKIFTINIKVHCTCAFTCTCACACTCRHVKAM